MKSGVWGVVFVCLFSAVVRGDEESDRRRYIDEIDRLLDGMADDLDRVVSDSGTSYVDYAIRKADEVRSKAGDLARVKGNDDKARRYADYYPRYADSFKEHAKYLRELKRSSRTTRQRSQGGREQARGYRGAVESYFEANTDRLKDTFTNKLSIFLKCIDDGRIRLETDIRAYEFCPADGKLFHDFVVPAD